MNRRKVLVCNLIISILILLTLIDYFTRLTSSKDPSVEKVEESTPSQPLARKTPPPSLNEVKEFVEKRRPDQPFIREKPLLPPEKIIMGKSYKIDICEADSGYIFKITLYSSKGEKCFFYQPKDRTESHLLVWKEGEEIEVSYTGMKGNFLKNPKILRINDWASQNSTWEKIPDHPKGGKPTLSQNR